MEEHDWMLINEALDMYKNAQSELINQEQELEDEYSTHSTIAACAREQLLIKNLLQA
jgi:hypothetical protein